MKSDKHLEKIKYELNNQNEGNKTGLYKILYINGYAIVKDRYSIATKNPETGRWDFSECIGDKTAKKLMEDAIKRMMFIARILKVESVKNHTADCDYYAKVAEQQTIFLSPEKYNESVHINIGFKFTKAPVYGTGSQVCTICHELSHFIFNGAHGRRVGND